MTAPLQPQDVLRAIDRVETERRVRLVLEQHSQAHPDDLLAALESYYASTQQAVPPDLLRKVTQDIQKEQLLAHHMPAELPPATLTRWERLNPKLERWCGRGAWMSVVGGSWLSIFVHGPLGLWIIGTGWGLGLVNLLGMIAALQWRPKYNVLQDRRKAEFAAWLDTRSTDELMAADRDQRVDYTIGQMVVEALARRLGRWDSQRYIYR